MEINLKIKKTLFNKLKALNQIKSQGNDEFNIDSYLLFKIEKILDSEILDHIGSKGFEISPVNSNVSEDTYEDFEGEEDMLFSELDATQISDGLGNEDVDYEIEEPFEKVEVTKAKVFSGITEEMLENDSPEDEGVVSEPGDYTPTISADEVFSSVSGLPTPPQTEFEESPHKKRRRRKQEIFQQGRSARKGKAVPFETISSSF